MSQRVLIFGASNFVGARVIARLREMGLEPVPMGESSVELTKADPLAIVNCTMGKPADVLGAARELAQTARRLTGVPVVHVGSMSVYGSLEGTVSEAATIPSSLSGYALAHAQAERLLDELGNVSVIRCGVEYGPGCGPWTDRIGQLLISGRLGDLGAVGDGICNLVFVGDLVEAILAGMRLKAGPKQVFNLAMRNPPTWNQYFVRFAMHLGATPVARVPAWRTRLESKVMAAPLKALGILAKPVGLSSRIHAITPSLLQACSQRILLDVSAAEEKLNCRWTSLEDGLAQAVRSPQFKTS